MKITKEHVDKLFVIIDHENRPLMLGIKIKDLIQEIAQEAEQAAYEDAAELAGFDAGIVIRERAEEIKNDA